jgi:hypothetical protein
LFLDLYDEDQPCRHLSKEQLADFYEKGLRPTVVELLQDRAPDWPATYSAELFRARGHDGRIAFSMKVIPDNLIPEFGDQLRHKLEVNGVTWAKNLVFLHEIRGVKNASYHYTDRDNADIALEELLDQNFLRLEDLNPDTWYIDVGLEISSRDKRCLGWRTDSHSEILQELAEVAKEHADRVTNIKFANYFRDPASHLLGVSGFRLTPGVRARGAYETAYVNVYHTDKGVTSRQDRGHYGKFITTSQIFQGTAVKYAEDLYNLNTTSATSNYSCARAEIRIPLRYATEPMVYINHAVLQRSLVSLSPNEWW